MDAIECIKTRRSVRSYINQSIDEQTINQILESAISAPSGKNGQPWKFKVVIDKNSISGMANLLTYDSWMETAPLFIAVFLDNNCSYDHVKDIQSCGAVMQNMMLATNALGIGSCWIGEILQRPEEVKRVLHIDNSKLELMGMIVFGYKAGRSVNPGRKKIEAFLL